MTARIKPITRTQKRVAALLVLGLVQDDIAAKMNVGPDTVKAHMRDMRKRLACPPGCDRRVLVHALLTHGQVDSPPLPSNTATIRVSPADRLLWRALAAHSRAEDIALAARISHHSLRERTASLRQMVGALDNTHLVALGHTLHVFDDEPPAGASRPAGPRGGTA
ncbi:LuxR C-terminal-related transcriptional regulator [Streptomyces sp. NPDC048717]|uniref:LuxR C-terminal-related transcriptional regulator n=1 Tax=Streptomyces sp. NPDC048717 TaxID=3154928 RepID=UPI00341B6B86